MTDKTPRTAAELLRIAFDCADAQNNTQAMADAAAALAQLERAQPLIVNVTVPPIAATATQADEAQRTQRALERTEQLIEAIGAEAEKTPSDDAKQTRELEAPTIPQAMLNEAYSLAHKRGDVRGMIDAAVALDALRY